MNIIFSVLREDIPWSIMRCSRCDPLSEVLHGLLCDVQDLTQYI